MIPEGGPDDRSALSRCVPVDAAAFAADYWGRTPLFTRAAELGRDSRDLLDSDDVDDLIAERALRTPFVRMAKEGSVLAAADYTGPGGFGAEVGDQLDSAAVLARFADGATLVLQGLHRTWPPLARFARRLAAELGHPVQINAYVTPASSRGFDPHYDVHDVFVLQVHGEKHWRIHEPVHPDPLRSQPWTDHRDAVAARAAEAPVIDEVFRPGDALYLPRGWIHSAEALGGTTIHITVGVASYTRQEIVQRLIERAADDARLRSSLPVGVAQGSAVDGDGGTDALGGEVEAVIEALIGSLQAARGDVSVRDAVADAIAARRRRDTPPDPVRPLAIAASIAGLSAGDRVRLRPGSPARTGAPGADGAVRILLAGSALALPAEAGAAVDALLTGAPVVVGELPGLEPASAVVVARRLLREGVLIPA